MVSGLPAETLRDGGIPPPAGPRADGDRLQELAGERRTSCCTRRRTAWPGPSPTWPRPSGRDRSIVVCRELTKLHEEIWRGTLSEALDHGREAAPRGEHVLVVAGAPRCGPAGRRGRSAPRSPIGRRPALDRRTAIVAVVEELRVPKRRVYALAHADVATGARTRTA